MNNIFVKTAFYRRQFLNTEEVGGAAYIEANVEEPRGCDGMLYVNASFKVADCNRVVELDFDVHDKDTANVRQKVLKLRRAIVAFTAAYLDQLDALDRMQ